FIDEHATAAGSLADVLTARHARLAKLDRERDHIEKNFPIEMPRAALGHTPEPQETVESLVSMGARVTMEIKNKFEKEKVNAEFKPRYDAAYDAFVDSLRAKDRLAQALALRYQFKFPVALTLQK